MEDSGKKVPARPNFWFNIRSASRTKWPKWPLGRIAKLTSGTVVRYSFFMVVFVFLEISSARPRLLRWSPF